MKAGDSMANFKDTYLSGSNIALIEGLHPRYLEDPSSIDPSWREIFDGQQSDGHPIFSPGEGGNSKAATNGNGQGAVVARPSSAPAAAVVARGAPAAALAQGESLQNMGLQAKVDQTVYAFR